MLLLLIIYYLHYTQYVHQKWLAVFLLAFNPSILDFLLHLVLYLYLIFIIFTFVLSFFVHLDDLQLITGLLFIIMVVYFHYYVRIFLLFYHGLFVFAILICCIFIMIFFFFSEFSIVLNILFNVAFVFYVRTWDFFIMINPKCANSFRVVFIWYF